MLAATLAGALLAFGAASAYAVSGLIIYAPGNLLVNNTTTYSASANANFLITETITQAVFTFPSNTDVSGATVTLSRGTPTVIIDNVNHRVTINTSATYLLGIGNPFTATVNNVVNPSEPGAYTYSVSITGNNTVSGTSATYTLLANGTVPGVGPVTLADPHESVVTTTTVPVKVGANGRLEATAQPGGVTTPNKIYITFPLGYTVPGSPAASSVTVNGTALSTAPTVSGRQVTIKIPNGVSITKNTTATVVFLPSFGMSNPTAGLYIATGSTSAETGPGLSAIYTVLPAPTTLTVSSANQPGGAYVLRSAVKAVDGFTMQRNASSNSVGVTSVTIEDTGTAPLSTVSGVDIYRDDGDGTYDSGDTKLNTAAATFTGSSATVSFTISEAITTTAEQYWVVYTFTGGAADGASASSRVSALAHTADALANGAGVGSTMLVDVADPTASFTAPAVDDTTLFGSIPPYVIAGTAADAVSGVATVSVRIQRASDSDWWNGAGWQSGETSVSASSSDGWATWEYSWSFTPVLQSNSDTYTITAVARDGVGHTGQATRSGVEIDNVAPDVDSASAVDPTHVDVVFSEALDASTVDATDFTIEGLSVSAAVLRPDGATVRLTTSLQAPGSSYTAVVGLGSVTDIAGNPNTAPASAGFAGAGALVRVESQSQPASAWATADAVLAVDGFSIEKTAGPDSASVASVTVENTGTATSADVDRVWVCMDTTANGVYDRGADATLNATPATFAGTSATITFDTPETAGAAVQYFVVYGFASGATDGRVATSKVAGVGTEASVLEIVVSRGNEFTVDYLPPSAPTASASAVSTAAIDVSWNAVTDSTSGLDHYALRKADGSLVTTTAGTLVRVSGLSSATEYGFYVEAIDVAGNISRSNTAMATTFAVDLFISEGLASGSYSGSVTGAAHRLTGAGFNKFQITDAAGVGWNVTVQATAFVNRDGTGHDVAAGSFWMPMLTATPVGGSPPAPPGSMTGPATIDGAAVLVQNCGVGEGQGVYDFTAPGASWGLDVAADQFAGTYDSTVTVTLSSGYR